MEYKTICKGIIGDQICWTILINGVEFNYSQGLGYVKTDNNLKKEGIKAGQRTVLKFDSSEQKEKIARKCFERNYHMMTFQVFAVVNPELDQVLYCLFSDSEAHNDSFENWADNFGYDSDSIAAKKIYDACIENYFKLKKALGKDFQTEKQRIESLEL
jgi:hypothetical protein